MPQSGCSRPEVPTPPAPPPSPRARLISRIALGLWVIALGAILIHVWLRPNSSTLYRTFHSGGARWLAGQPLYPKVDEFIYSPLAAAFFAPFALLPDNLAGILWRLISSAVYIGAFAAWLRHARVRPLPAALAWLLLLPLSVGDLYNGQANPLIIGLLIFAILGCRNQRWVLAALCVGLATYFKVYPLAVGLLLALIHPRRFPLRLIIALVLLFLLSLVLQRPAYAFAQYGNWFHSLGLDPRRTLNYFGTYRDVWLFLRILHIPISPRGWTLLQLLSGAALALYLWLIQRRGAATEVLDFLLLALGVCWMLLFGPATESATYVILAPPLILALIRWQAEPGARPYARSAIAALSSYILLIASQMLSSWAPRHQDAYTHTIQPAAALILAIALLIYGWPPPKPKLAPGPPVR